MQLNGEFEVSAPVKEVYSFMSNIERVTTIIPDVISLEKAYENSVRLVAKAGTFVIKGKFNLTFEIKDRKVNESVGISARGSGVINGVAEKPAASITAHTSDLGSVFAAPSNVFLKFSVCVLIYFCATSLITPEPMALIPTDPFTLQSLISKVRLNFSFMNDAPALATKRTEFS